jgi:hypothetical protein
MSLAGAQGRAVRVTGPVITGLWLTGFEPFSDTPNALQK